MKLPHDEYFIYTTNARLERRFVHLTEEDISEAMEYEELVKDSEWKGKFRKAVADNIFLTVSDKSIGKNVRLESRSQVGWDSVRDGDFALELFFDEMIYYKCTGSEHPEWSYPKVREWINKEHRGVFEEEFEEYLDNLERDDYVVDW